ncbi:FAD-binding oxidoreductase [Lederbergia citrea]|uniref:D-lactate dehydrogenase (cytochrome) n=1 Tax=Lederbergia citrea TaxID=2833581 RepID=A0A942URR3_9BACI|nr:FAD-linked oxidase C-terminal domain-containing protein [Lederbergia citrea]MBS4204588.1 FAD-binding protein [Lederbergia citrea]MBS4223568.1 FAD-binding protein [Lederbergia citrea]
MNLLEDLYFLIGTDKVTINETLLRHHSGDESHHPKIEPDAVVFPESTEDVQKIVSYANEHQIAIVPYGAGSGLEGQAIPIKKGISINFERMDQILEVRPEDLTVKVQPGVTRHRLNDELKKYGLFFPVDPGADASIGGMAATNASGTLAVRYGVMRDQILNMEVVLADGRVIKTGSLARKSSSGYHLNGLFVGSEGTLGVFTEITLKLHGIPEYITAARCTFPSVRSCVDAAAAILTAGISIARVELVDARSIKQVNDFSGTNYPEEHSLFLEFHGNKSGNEEDIDFVQAIVEEAGCTGFVFETDSIKRANLWKARHELHYAFSHGFPKLSILSTDVCVPISKLPEIVEFTRNQLDGLGLDGGVLGHVGDGNFHATVLYDRNDPEQVKKMQQLNEELVAYALRVGGTCTGEHGVGIGKMKFQEQEHGAALDVMIALKNTLDPNNILNPGKVLPIEMKVY